MKSPLLTRLVLLAFATLASASQIHAQAPTAEQLKSWISIRKERVNLLRDEIKQIDARIESRIDMIVGTLKTLTDSQNSGTKVARMKEDTGKRLMKTITYYDQKRVALKEELRNPRLRLTAQEKEKMIAIFDARIAKRTDQILELYKSMPAFQDEERYRATGSGWWGTEYERNKDFEQNRRMTTHSNQQREAIVKQLDASLARLDRQNRTLKANLNATNSPVQRTALNEEIAKDDALIAERRQQREETLLPGGTAARTVALNEAMDMDKAMQAAARELSVDFTTLFQRYNTLLNELSSLHSTEAVLAATPAR